MFIFPTFSPFFIRKVLFCPESHVKWMANAPNYANQNRERSTRSYPVPKATEKRPT